MDSDQRQLQIWNEARAAAMNSGIYPTDFIISYLLAKQVALLEQIAEQTKPPSEPIEEKPDFPRQAMGTAKAMNVVSEDATGCCARIRKALRDDEALAKWECPRCGLVWLPRETDGVMMWEPQVIIQVWR